MKVLVDTRSFFYCKANPVSTGFFLRSFIELQQSNDDLEFIFLADQFSKKIVDNTSGSRILTINPLPGKLGWKFWYDWQIPRLIKKNEIGLFISCCAISSSVKIPQCIFLPGDFKNQQSKKPTSFFSFYRARKKTSLIQANTIFVFSEFTKQSIVQQCKLNAGKIYVLPPAANENYKPFLWTERENAKIKFAGGKEYFVVMGMKTTQEIIVVLKAFSQFKKRQQSNMQLIIVGEKLSNNLDLTEKIETFKYRPDVYLHDIENEKNTCDILSAAYALIYSSGENEPAIEIVNACMANIPVIASKTNSLIELFEDSIVYSDISNYDLLSADMITIYKDENLRKQLIEKEKIKSSQFSFRLTSNQLWNGIMNATNNQQ
ncbi:MAG: glycosyltransferase [Bacteroidetes bacterium]|nr:glycosyltransferase [Bacteroidota bacterium]